ncbi:cyd operon YbgE family protein [Aquabacterium sp.]|uniref:cyd operon YbgE family protein n=1 Tax=Aquabacterium sp. TaxID=1872578 RepID=UPI0024875AAC|nr:cyd operon YbgE family protein [Aquabacterium sp.]MDI1261512.1 cyd operon YbgE family protein [Aquabacterium sp.]
MKKSAHAMMVKPTRTPTPTHLPSLLVGLTIMLVGTVYPPLMVNAAGHADHGLAMALFMAMAAGFVRGIGFVPRHVLWRVLFSGWACAAALLAAACLKCLH